MHHINGDGLDNRLENLQAMSRSEHGRIHYRRPLMLIDKDGTVQMNVRVPADIAAAIRARAADEDRTIGVVVARALRAYLATPVLHPGDPAAAREARGREQVTPNLKPEAPPSKRGRR